MYNYSTCVKHSREGVLQSCKLHPKYVPCSMEDVAQNHVYAINHAWNEVHNYVLNSYYYVKSHGHEESVVVVYGTENLGCLVSHDQSLTTLTSLTNHVIINSNLSIDTVEKRLKYMYISTPSIST